MLYNLSGNEAFYVGFDQNLNYTFINNKFKNQKVIQIIQNPSGPLIIFDNVSFFESTSTTSNESWYSSLNANDIISVFSFDLYNT